jgi:phosphocarrier protein HPr
MDEFTAISSAPLTNPVGLHARPSVKLTKLAKTFAAHIEVAPAENGPWVDAKSIVKVMAVKAAKGTILHFRAIGPDARAALGALRDLVARNFEEDETGRGVEGPENAHG